MWLLHRRRFVKGSAREQSKVHDHEDEVNLGHDLHSTNAWITIAWLGTFGER